MNLGGRPCEIYSVWGGESAHRVSMLLMKNIDEAWCQIVTVTSAIWKSEKVMEKEKGEASLRL